MSLEEVTTEIIESIKSTLMEKLNELLPELIQGLLPNLIELSKEVIVNQINNTDYTKQLINESISAKEEFKCFKEKNKRYVNDKLILRENEYQKYARCDHLINLYKD